jgi:hypothetical protein
MALWQALQLPLQQKNHRAPDLHTVAPGLCTVVFFRSPTSDRVQFYQTLYIAKKDIKDFKVECPLN